jgi:hypothetical protein
VAAGSVVEAWAECGRAAAVWAAAEKAVVEWEAEVMAVARMVAACLVEDLACGHTRARLRNAVSIGREFRRNHARVASGE